MFLNHFYLSLPPGLSKKSACRLNVTLMASATGTVITKKIGSVYITSSLLDTKSLLRRQPVILLFSHCFDLNTPF